MVDTTKTADQIMQEMLAASRVSMGALPPQETPTREIPEREFKWPPPEILPTQTE